MFHPAASIRLDVHVQALWRRGGSDSTGAVWMGGTSRMACWIMLLVKPLKGSSLVFVKWSTTASHLRGFKSPGNTERVRIRFLYRIVKIIWQQHLVFENGMTWNWIQPPVTQPFTESSGPSLLRWVWTLVLGWYWTTGIRTSALVTTYGGVTLCITLYVYIYISWIWINIRIPNKDGNAIILRIWPLDVFRGFNEFLRSQLISECRGSNMTVESPCLLRVMPADLSWGWGCQWIRKLASVMLELLKRHENSWKYTPNLFGWWFWRWLKTVGTSFQQIIWFIPCSKRFRISCIVFSGASIPAAAREQQGRRRPQLKPPWTGHEAGPAEPWERCSLVVKHGEPLATGLNADKWFVK